LRAALFIQKISFSKAPEETVVMLEGKPPIRFISAKFKRGHSKGNRTRNSRPGILLLANCPEPGRAFSKIKRSPPTMMNQYQIFIFKSTKKSEALNPNYA